MFRRYFVPILKVTGFIVLYFMSMLISYALTAAVGSLLPNGESRELLGAFSGFAAALLLVLIYLQFDRKSFRDIGIRFDAGWGRKLLRGAIEGLLIMLSIIAIMLVSGLGACRGIEALNLAEALKRLAYGFLLYLAFVAFTEELLTRGYMYHYLKSKFTIAGAIIATSSIFALMHLLNPNVTVLALINVFLAGLVLNLYILRDGSIWSAVGFHFGWNYTMGVIFTSPVSGTNEEGIIKLSLKGYELLSGGSFGIEGGLVCTAALLVMSIYLLRSNTQANVFLQGLKRAKNLSFIGVLIILMLANAVTDTLVWMSPRVVSDSLELNSVPVSEDVNEYIMELKLDTSNKTLTGQQKVNYINKSGKALNEIYFHIYPNAFGESGGSIAVNNVKLNGVNAEAAVEGSDRTLLKVKTGKVLEPNGKAEIYMEYAINIAAKSGNGFGDRFGFGDNTFNLGNFFPIAAVYDNDGWDLHLYDSKGDAFYSEAGNFKVRLTAPESQVVACTGEVQNVVDDGRNKIWSIEARSVRDFAFVSSDMFKLKEAKVNGILLRSYAASAVKAEKALQISADAIRIFNRQYGKYPYPTCSIVETDISGGMEYPNLVMIESNSYGNIGLSSLMYSSMYGSLIGNFEFVIVHELAHQWWYGIVGNNEYTQAWIDEPLTQYSTLQYYKDKYGQKSFDRVYERYIKSQYRSFKAMALSENPSMERPLNNFEENEYYILIYNKGTMMYKDLNDRLGDSKYNQLMRTLFDRYKFKTVKGSDLIKLTSEIAGKDMSDFYSKWLYSDYTADEL